MENPEAKKTTKKKTEGTESKKTWAYFENEIRSKMSSLNIEDPEFEEKLKGVIEYLENAVGSVKLSKFRKAVLLDIVESIKNRDEKLWSRLLSLSRGKLRDKKELRDTIFLLRPLYEKVQEREISLKVLNIEKEIENTRQELNSLESYLGEKSDEYFNAERLEAKLNKERINKDFEKLLKNLEELDKKGEYQAVLDILAKVKSSNEVLNFSEPEDPPQYLAFVDLVMSKLIKELGSVQENLDKTGQINLEIDKGKESVNLQGAKEEIFEEIERFFRHSPSWDVDFDLSAYKIGQQTSTLSSDSDLEEFYHLSEDKEAKIKALHYFFEELGNQSQYIPFFHKIYQNINYINSDYLEIKHYERELEIIDRAETDFKAKLGQKRDLESKIKALEDRKKGIIFENIIREDELLAAGLKLGYLLDLIPAEALSAVKKRIRQGEGSLNEEERRKVKAVSRRLAEKVLEIQENLDSLAFQIKEYLLKKDWEDPKRLASPLDIAEKAIQFFNDIHLYLGRLGFEIKDEDALFEKMKKMSEEEKAIYAASIIDIINENKKNFWPLYKRRWLRLPISPYDGFLLSESLELIKLKITQERTKKLRTEEYLEGLKHSYLEEAEKLKPYIEKFIKAVNGVLRENGEEEIKDVEGILTVDPLLIEEAIKTGKVDISEMKEINKILEKMKKILSKGGIWNAQKKIVENLFPPLKVSDEKMTDAFNTMLNIINRELRLIYNNLDELTGQMVKRFGVLKMSDEETRQKFIEGGLGEEEDIDFWKNVLELRYKDPGKYEEYIQAVKSEIESLKLQRAPFFKRKHFLDRAKEDILRKMAKIKNVVGKGKLKKKADELPKEEKSPIYYKLSEKIAEKEIKPNSLKKLREVLVSQYLNINSWQDIKEENIKYLFFKNPNQTKKEIKKRFKDYFVGFPGTQAEEAARSLIFELENFFVKKINSFLPSFTPEKAGGSDVLKALNLIILLDKTHISFDNLRALREKLKKIFVDRIFEFLPKLTANHLLDIKILLNKTSLPEKEKIGNRITDLLTFKLGELKFKHAISQREFSSIRRREREAEEKARQKKEEEKRKKEKKKLTKTKRKGK